MKRLEEMVQEATGALYILAFSLLLIPVTVVNVVWHAGLDAWEICEDELRSSKRL